MMLRGIQRTWWHQGELVNEISQSFNLDEKQARQGTRPVII